MKRYVRFILMTSVISLFFITLVACGSDDTGGQSEEASGQETFEWKMGTIYQDPSSGGDYMSLSRGQQKFVELVNERTDGRITITPYYDSVLGGNEELFQKLRLGEVEVFYGQPMSTIDERFGAWNIPYLFETLEEAAEANCPDGELYKLSAEWVRDHDLELLAVGAGALRGFANSKKEIVSPEDLQDVKARIYQDPIVDIFWGGISNTTQLPFSEVYTALETNTVDGLELQATSILGRQMDEVTSHYTDLNWQWVSGANIVVSGEHFNNLPEDLQKIVKEAAVEAMEYQGELEMEDSQKALDELEENGVDVHRLTEEERQAWKEYARSLDDDIKEAIGEDVFEQVMNAVK